MEIEVRPLRKEIDVKDVDDETAKLAVKSQVSTSNYDSNSSSSRINKVHLASPSNVSVLKDDINITPDGDTRPATANVVSMVVIDYDGK